MNQRTVGMLCVSLLLVLGAFLLVRHIWFPPVSNVWFQPENQQLHDAPANLMVLRQTQLESRRPGTCTEWMGGKNNYTRYAGRNVPLEQIIPLAYQCRRSQVLMPPDAPTNHYDFIDTLKHQTTERFQQAIKKSTGYVADWQDCEADVWLLQVRNPSAFKVSNGNEFPGIHFVEGSYVFTHMQLSDFAGFVENEVSRPVKDHTGLNGYYDFSVVWYWPGWDTATEDNVKKSLGEIGLVLAPGTDTVHMLVVITIIAILAALLIPVLSTGKDRALALQCLNNQRQLNVLHVSQVQDGGEFITYVWQELWMPKLLGSNNINSPLGYCPKAPTTSTPASQIRVVDGGLRRPWQQSHWEGSLGFNGYLFRGISPAYQQMWGLDSDYMFNKESAVLHPSDTPVFFDAMWPDTWPVETNVPPDNLVDPNREPAGIQRVTMPRHGSAPPDGTLKDFDPKNTLPGSVNVVFYDGHGGLVKLEDLWTLQWHANWITPAVRPGK